MDMIENVTLTQVISVVLLVLIGVLAYKTILTLSDIQVRKKYVLKSVLKQEQEERENARDLPFLERFTSWNRYRAYIEYQLEDAKSPQSFNRFMLIRFGLAFMAVIYAYGIGSAFDVPVITYISLPVAVLIFNIPMKRLQKRKENYLNQLRMELPDYFSSLSILLESRSPLTAIKESITYAGEHLHPYVENLITEIELYPADSRPFVNFANRVQIREAKEFMIALEQMMKVDTKNSASILNYQLEIMSELKEGTYNEEIENRENVLDNYIISIILPYIVVILTFVGVLMYTQFSNFTTF